MKHRLPALLLAGALALSGSAAALTPDDFRHGALSDLKELEDGSLLVCDSFNKVLWRVDGETVTLADLAAGQISVPGLDGEPIGIYHDATRETALFKEPWGVAPFLEGYAVSDTAAHVVRYVDEETVRTAAGAGEPGYYDGFGIEASFDGPTGLAAGPNGVLYIADTGNGAIRRLNTEGDVSTVVTGLVEPTGLCYANGTLYVAETGRSRVCAVRGGTVRVLAGGGEADEDGVYPVGYADGPAEKARFNHPQGIAVAEDGTVYIADTGNGAIRKLSNGRVTTLAPASQTPNPPIQPRGLLLRSDGTLAAADLFAQNLLLLDPTPVTYLDVPEGAWYGEAVYEAAERGLTTGTGGGNFTPDAAVTRAMFVTMLSRVHQYTDGAAVINGGEIFPDVPTNAWYADAVRWAADQGITSGYDDGTFGPGDSITREQLVTMLYRYAVEMGHDVSVGENTNILSYTDAFDISEYAIPAFQWACGAGVISGMGDGSLAPRQTATRAQTAKLLVTFMDELGM